MSEVPFPRYVYFIAYTGSVRSGHTYTASTEMTSAAQATRYEVIQGWAAEITRNNSNIANVVILNFQLLRVDGAPSAEVTP